MPVWLGFLLLLVGLSSGAWAIGTWTFVDGGGANGINYNSGRSGNDPAVAAYNGELYVAWMEPNAGAINQIRVKKYTPGTGLWSWVDGGGANGLNFGTSENAYRPALAVYDGHLYLAWDEHVTSPLADQIRVRRYDGGSTWTAVDGGGSGLNHYEQGRAQDVTLSLFQDVLYATWAEVVNSVAQIRVRRYDGGSAWTFVDHAHTGAGCAVVGINYDSLEHGFRPRLMEYNSALYAAWEENYGASDIHQVRIKRYSGGAWSFVDGGGATGLNFDAASHALIPSLGVLGNLLYLAWYEGVEPPWGTGFPNIRLRTYNGSAWNAIDGGGLDHGSDTWSYDPEMILHNHLLYFSWDEEHGTTYTFQQIRVRKYNGSTFTFIDGDGPAGLNYDPGVKAVKPALAVLQDSLYVAWQEPEEGAPKQIRVKKIDLPSASLVPDLALTEANVDSRYITVTLANTTFADATLSAANFTLEDEPAGLTIESVSYVDATHCRVYLAYDGRDFDTDISELGLTIDGTELADGDDVTASNVLSITATSDAESISIADDGQILERAENGEVITVTLSGGTFAASLTPANWTVTNLPAGVSKGSVSRINSTTVQIALSGNASGDYDTDITDVTVSCTAAEYLDSTGSLQDSSGVTLQARTTPTVTTTDPPSTITANSATIAGNVTSDGKATVTARGIEYKKSTDAVYTAVAAGSAGTGAYSVAILGLTASTEYNARAYATNEEGTAYGNVITFFTAPPTALTLRSVAGHRVGTWGLPLLILAVVGLFAVSLLKSGRRS